MGSIICGLRGLFTSKIPKEIAIVGLDNAGKTTILYRMKEGALIKTIPTIGFNVEILKVGSATFNAWDIGGQDNIRPLWESYIEMAVGVVYVMDIIDLDRFQLAADELLKVTKQYPEKPVLVLANKADDCSDCYEDQTNKLRSLLGWGPDNNQYSIHCVSALNAGNEGQPEERLMRAFEWIAYTVNGKCD